MELFQTAVLLAVVGMFLRIERRLTKLETSLPQYCKKETML